MSVSKEQYMEAEANMYEQYIEEQRQALRLEGAEELRADILRQINQMLEPIHLIPDAEQGLILARDVVENAFI